MSKIEWTDVTWNPITGCTPISEGCLNCYAARMAKRLAGRFGYPKDEPFKPTYHPDRLGAPAKWKQKKVFVNSMGDLFHDEFMSQGILAGERIYQIYYEMRYHRECTFIVLTKRPKNADYFYKNWIKPSDYYQHLWLGVTAENQNRADERIPVLVQIPAAVRFVSVEPILGPVDLDKYIMNTEGKYMNVLECGYHYLNWVIAGPETGPGARPCNPKWIEDLYEQCKSAGVPFFDKRKTGWLAREFPKPKGE